MWKKSDESDPGSKRTNWGHAQLVIIDAMKLPTAVPRFPVLDSTENPSLKQIKVLQAGLLNRLTRTGLWKIYYCVLTDKGFTLFTGYGNELHGKVEMSFPLDSLRAVEEGPALKDSSAGSTLAVSLYGTSSKMILAAFDKTARQQWIASLTEAINNSNEVRYLSSSEMLLSVPRSQSGMDISDPMSADPGISVLCVSTMDKPSRGSANPAWGNVLVRISPAWGDSMTCSLQPGGQIRVWMNNGLVCCLQAERKPIWRDARTMAVVPYPGYQLDYKLQGLSLAPASSPGPSFKAQVKHQMAAYAGLVLVLNGVLLGLISAGTGYWLSMLLMVAALGLGALPGPSPESREASSAPLGGLPARLQLISCSPDLSAADGPTLGRSASLVPEDCSEQLPEAVVADAKEDPGLEAMQQHFPDENIVKLKRFLVARKHVVEDAVAMVKGDMALRAQLAPVEPVGALSFLKADLVHFVGYAMDGTPLVFVKLRNLNKQEPTEGMQRLVLLICDLAAQLAPEQQCMTIFADLQGFSLSKNVDFSKLKDCISVLNACLPEVLRRVFVINAPYVFQAVWGFVRELLDPATADKVRVLGKKEWGLLTTFISPEVLPEAFGGSNKDAYDPASNVPGALNWGPVDVPKAYKG
mmetsp:Transcript_20919/g.58022  ORF Transcript_20919/g.58022 Transcript_20919/m.58022 type:complete len:638 (-) Transcript_20919:96-2009(-)